MKDWLADVPPVQTNPITPEKAYHCQQGYLPRAGTLSLSLSLSLSLCFAVICRLWREEFRDKRWAFESAPIAHTVSPPELATPSFPPTQIRQGWHVSRTDKQRKKNTSRKKRKQCVGPQETLLGNPQVLSPCCSIRVLKEGMDVRHVSMHSFLVQGPKRWVSTHVCSSASSRTVSLLLHNRMLKRGWL